MSLRLIPRLEELPQVVAQSMQPAGRWIVFAAFTPLLIPLNRIWFGVAAAVALTIVFPKHRYAIVSIAGIALPVAMLPMSGAAYVVPAGLAALALRFPQSLLARYPVRTAVIGYLALLATISATPLDGWAKAAAWTLALALGRMLWFFCYNLVDRERSPLQAGFWRPLWMAFTDSPTAFGKGPAYLRRIDARTPEQLAVTRLKAVKLLLWALMLSAADLVLEYVLYRAHPGPAIPTFQAAFEASVAGHPFPWYANCASLVAAFCVTLLQLSVWGHQIVACMRMAGFRALRNTWRPLEARTVAEFWNRYYFYFKELLVDLFFYPTFTRYFRKYRRLRMVAATMAAACFGNALFHFLRDISYIEELGWWRAAVGFQTYLFYTLVLGAAISVSQLRAKRKQPPSQSWLRRRLAPAVCVVGFYCLLHIFDDTGRTYGLREHFVFLGRLIGL